MTIDGPRDPDYFRARYARATSPPASDVERSVFGEETGVSGYTTVAQAERLGDLLDLKASSLLLDLGAGRGWPGLCLASLRNCRLVLVDLPTEGLRRARSYASARGVSDLTSAVCCDGGALPFRPGSFDAIVHTDVLC